MEEEVEAVLRLLAQEVGQEHGLVPLQAEEGGTGIELRETETSQQRVGT